MIIFRFILEKYQKNAWVSSSVEESLKHANLCDMTESVKNVERVKFFVVLGCCTHGTDTIYLLVYLERRRCFV